AGGHPRSSARSPGDRRQERGSRDVRSGTEPATSRPRGEEVRMSLPSPHESMAWSLYLRVQYRLIRLLDPLIRLVWRGYGLGNIVELRLVGRRTGKPRPVLVGMLRVGSSRYVGHPNGDTAWIRNLEAAGTVQLCEVWPRLE